jgi:putative thioredoxin
MANSPYVVETTPERFQEDVIERSRQSPVVLDFWAAWCQPCRMLAPLLEKLADEYGGRFTLVKANTDHLPQEALAFGVEGIPAVYALRDAQVVDSFTGLLSESQLRQWLAAILPTEAELVARQAAALEATDAAAAEAIYRQALALDRQLPAANIGLARLLLARGAREEAAACLAPLEARGFLEPEAEQLKAQLQLAAAAVSPAELARLRSAVVANPADGAARLALAEGLQAALEVVTSARGPLRDQARAQLLSALKALGEDSELAREYRRKLALALY